MIKFIFPRIRIVLVALGLSLAAATSARASVTIVIQVAPGDTGFSDSTAVAPIGGNSGTTLGQQRLNAFQFAASIWGATLNSGPPILINAKWVGLSCTANSAVLAQSGAKTIHRDFPNAAFSNTWYSVALANALSGSDQNGGDFEIDAEFNVNIGTSGCFDGSPWYLGFDGGHGGGVDLVSVLLHEFGHGLGFQSFTTLTTGVMPSPGSTSIYNRFLLDNSTGKRWNEMTNAERVTSATNTGNLVWAGSQATNDVPGVLGTPRLRVNSPGAIAGDYPVGTAGFGSSLSSPGVTGTVVRALDAANGAGPTTTDGCSSFTNSASVAGNIAFIDRGTCNFIDKVKNAQAAGATAVIIGNVATSNLPNTPPNMGAVGPPALISIPTVGVAVTSADSIRGQLGSGVNSTVFLDHSVRIGADASNRALMYTPSSLATGSSVSHFDISAYPNLLMEPNDSGDLSQSVSAPRDLTLSLFRDLGWTGSVAAPTVQLTAASFSVTESGPTLSVGVTRSGDTSSAVSVAYSSADTSGSNTCNLLTGQASSRCDYLMTLGNLTFAAGETSKTISIPIVDDAYAEGAENFSIALSNVSGASLGSPSSATITINDNEGGNGVNPISQSSFFVRQHYLDFLNREPDPDGLAFWIGEINSCGADAQCIEAKRINVSAAFFLSIEFQQTGYLVYRVYKTGLGNLLGTPVPVSLVDFLRDTQTIGKNVQVGIGNWEAQLEANKVAFTQAFVQRPDFLLEFPNSMTAAEVVDNMNANAGGGILSPGERSNLIAVLGGTPADVIKRAQVLRSVAEDADLLAAESNRAFVLMQYFGYLRRNPNDAPENGLNFDGYNFWLGKLNQFNGNFVDAEMVKAFIISDEYKQRFGP